MLILPCCSVLSDGVCLSELKCLLTYLLTYTKDKKWNVKLIFRGAYRLSGKTTFFEVPYGYGAIVECLEIIDVECNLKQFDGLI